MTELSNEDNEIRAPFFSSGEVERMRLAKNTEAMITNAIAQTDNGRGWGYSGIMHPLVRPMESHPLSRQLCEADNSKAPLVLGFLLGTTPVMAESLIPNIEEVTNLPELNAHVFPGEFQTSALRIPIQQAVSAFALGHWLTVIVLSGSTSELLSVILYQLALPKIKSKFASLSNLQKGLVTSDRKFAELGQSERVSRLEKLEIVDESISFELSEIRKLRNVYVHPSRGIKQSPIVQKRDARDALQRTCKLVQDCLIVGTYPIEMHLWNPLFFEHLWNTNQISITTIDKPRE